MVTNGGKLKSLINLKAVFETALIDGRIGCPTSISTLSPSIPLLLFLALPPRDGMTPTPEDVSKDSAKPGIKLRWLQAASTTAANDADSNACATAALLVGVLSLTAAADPTSLFLLPSEETDGVGDWLLGGLLTSSIMSTYHYWHQAPGLCHATIFFLMVIKGGISSTDSNVQSHSVDLSPFFIFYPAFQEV
mmetsp:Transcript_21615/g.32973  ORF Transcript_21615/g.32973 Transcript_21615/m.32973 type:complete len:192 (-) Transcript_21615:14-589(-)